MATKTEILAILRRGLTGVSEEDLDTLAGQLASSGTRLGPGAAAATEEELKARKEYLQSVGEMNKAREEEQAFLEQQISLKKQEIEGLQLGAAAAQAAAQAAKQNAEATDESRAALEAEAAAAANAAKGAGDLRVELQKLKQRQAALKIEAKQTGQAFGFLGSAISNTTKEFAEIADTGATLTGVFTTLHGTTKDFGGAMLNLASSDVVQGFARQTDALNMLVSETQKAFEMASKLDTMNTNLYKTMGIASGETKKFSFQLAELADDTSSLSRVGPELGQAAMALQQAQKGFDFERDKGMVQQIALLQQAGMSADIAAEVYTLYSKAGGDMAQQAGDINLKLLAIARELGQAPDQVAASFKSGMSAVAAYGNRAESVFGRMLAVANKLGTSIEDMISSMENLDEIDAAQKVAGELNAILQLTGKDALQGFMLAAADAPEKLMMIQKALATDQARAMLEGPGGRFRLKEVASRIPLTAENIRKLMAGGPDELTAITKKMADVQAMTLEELQEGNKNALDASARAAKNNEMVTKELVGAAQGTRDLAADTLSGAGGKGLLAVAGLLLGPGLMFGLKKMGASGAAAGLGAAGVSAIAGQAGLGGASDSEIPRGVQSVFVTRFHQNAVNDLASAFRSVAGVGGGGGGGGGGIGLDPTDAAKSGLGRKLLMGGAVVGGLTMVGKDVVDIATSEGPAKKEDIGGVVGGVIGAALGSVIPGLGTAIGLGVGGMLGNYLGGMVGASADQSQAQIQANTKKQLERLVNMDRIQVKAPNEVKDDFRINSSDEIVGVKEGGLIAKKLDRLISIMSGEGAKQDVILQIDGNEVGKAAIKSINNNYYNMRD